MKTLKLVSKIVFCSGLLTIGSVAHALTLLDVKIGTTTNNGGGDGVFQENGTAALGSATDWWNEFAYITSTPTSAAVVDSGDNPLTGVTVTVTNSAGIGFKITTGGNPDFLFNAKPYQNAGGVFTISLTGLAASSEYEFVGYAARPAPSAGGTWDVTVGTFDSGTTMNTGASVDVTTGNGISYSEFLANTNASGDLTITDSDNPGTAITVLDGFQLETAPVPEPGAWALILGGGAICFASLRAKFGQAS